MSSKAQKEAFVTGHSGTTISEIILVCLSSPIGILLFHELRHYCRKSNFFSNRQDEELPFSLLIFFESITILLPMTICETELLYPYGAILLSLELLIGLSLWVYRNSIYEKSKHRNASRVVTSVTSPTAEFAKLKYLSFYRSTVNFLTFVAILAVDFPIFPRSFAKTEIYGYGLMDIGAGSFCVIGGLVSSFARQKNSHKHEIDMRKRLKKIMTNIIPLLCMGFIRLITTKGLQYQRHVSEYGVHWNFYFTLAIVNAFASFIRIFPDLRAPFVSWMPILVIYQIILSKQNIQGYIELAPRQCKSSDNILNINICNFFAANREGILGSLGYLSIFLACEDVGRFCIWSCRKQNPIKQGRRIFIAAMFFWNLHWISSSSLLFDIIVSRRSTNATFCFWTIAHNMTILFFVWAAFHFGSDRSSFCDKSRYDSIINPPIFDAVNKHALIVFVLANLMTGVVNLTMNTLEASNGEAIIVIFCYLCAVGAAALIVSHFLSHGKSQNTI